MKKVFYYLSMAAIAATLGACSSNDDVDAGENETGTLGQTFLNVRIALSGSDDGTRAATDGGYVNGSGFETTVGSANFLFFNEDGSFLTSGKLPSISSTDQNTGSNIEKKVNATVVLGPTTVKPSTNIYMLTFLNREVTDLIGSTYEEVLEKTTKTDYNVSSNVPNAEMTNSIYYDTDSKLVQANIISSKNFKETASKAKEDTPIDVYVERTVAKASMSITATTAENLAAALSDMPYKDNSGFYFFPLTSKEEKAENATFVPFSLDGTDRNHFAVKVLGWTPNVLNEKGYLMKKINSDTEYKYFKTTTNEDGTTAVAKEAWAIDYWNKATDHRSFWAEDDNYKTGETWQSLKFWSMTKFNGTDLTGTLSAPVSATTYIYENTVTQDSAKYEGGTQHANVPTMLVVGQVGVLESENSTFTPKENLYRYLGAFYTTDTPIKEVEKNFLKKYYYDKNGTKTQIDDDLLSSLTFTFDAMAAVGTVNGETTTKLYNGIYFPVSSIKSGNDDFKIYKDTGASTTAMTINDINNALKANFVKSENGSKDNAIYYYNKGYCFYQVPIEHPVTYSGQTATNGETLASGTIYGVVRNHSYELTLNSITTVGQSVAKTDETIELIPGKDKYYYLGTQINVLAWRNVTNQSVDL